LNRELGRMWKETSHDLFEAIFCPIVLPRVTAVSHEERQFSETRIDDETTQQ